MTTLPKSFADRLNALKVATPAVVVGLIYEADAEIEKLRSENEEIKKMWRSMAQAIVEIIKKFERKEKA